MTRFALIGIILISACSTNTEEGNQTSTSSEQSTAVDTLEKNNTGFNLENFQQLVEQYEDPKRATWQNPSLIVNKLGDLKNKTVADIGAGTGYFTFRMVEEGARVIAIDIENRFLEYIENRKSELADVIDSDKVITRLSPEDDPLLSQNEVDIALVVNTYHFLDNRPSYLQKIAWGLKPGGRIIIVDYKSGKLPVGPPETHKISLAKTEQEIKKAGLKILEVDSKSLNYQYIITAKKK